MTAATPEIDICKFSTGDLIDSRWRVDAFLGEGTFGQVFKVADTHHDDEVAALKLLKLWAVPMHERQTILGRFDREFDTGLIKSPYLVHSRCKGMVKGNPYIVMDYCQGGDLKRANRDGHVNLPLIARNILLGLRDLHVAGRVHRDLKPENVLLCDYSHAVLTDFGIAGDQNNRLTQRGVSGVPTQRFGTMAYMPPEQASPRGANATVLPTTDLFSFGVMIYQLLTGELPFGRLASHADIVPYTRNAAVGNWNRDRILSLGVETARWLPLLEATLEPDFSKRISTAEAVMELLPYSSADEAFFSDMTVMESFPMDLSHGVVLRVTQGDGQGEIYDLSTILGPGNVINIGRKSSDVFNNLIISGMDASYISRQHCSMERNPSTGIWGIRDGQFRVQCAKALSMPMLFPCMACGGNCLPQVKKMRWMKSLNGTYLNSEELDHNIRPVKAGDIISIGEIKLRVEGKGASF